MATINAIGSNKPIEVPFGGIGDASNTAYAVLCGGTTPTGPIQSIASVGTSGQVLTSNGASALPTFQTASSGIATLNGDTGSATGSTVTISGSTYGLNTSGSGSTLSITAHPSVSGSLGAPNNTASVTLNARMGQVWFTAATIPGGITDYTITNSNITTSSAILACANQQDASSAATNIALFISAVQPQAGSVIITVENIGANSTISSPLSITFWVLN